jgi:hypothetical protein
MPASSKVEVLVRAWIDYAHIRWPESVGETGLDPDVLVELDLDDGYLAGLVTSYLGLDPSPISSQERVRNEQRLHELLSGALVPGGRLSVDSIALFSDVDRVIESAVPSSVDGGKRLDKFRTLRRGTRRLAEALSAATGVPIVDQASTN